MRTGKEDEEYYSRKRKPRSRGVEWEEAGEGETEHRGTASKEIVRIRRSLNGENPFSTLMFVFTIARFECPKFSGNLVP